MDGLGDAGQMGSGSGERVTDKALVAVDLGGESCRVSLLRRDKNGLTPQLIHRFPNGPVAEGRRLYWDIEHICAGVEKGIRLCAEAASEGIASVGVDGWGVDYVRMKADGGAAGKAFCYRDERTVEAEKQVHKIISRERLYELTGIQFHRINTIYQLFADRAEGIDERLPWLQISEYVTHWLGGEAVCEFTNVTHSELVERKTHGWCDEIFHATGIDRGATHKVVRPGYVAGPLKAALAELPALRSAQLIVPACHDTASAIAGIPADGDDWAFISSGTWSLVGTLLDTPCATKEAFGSNFTNLGGVGGKTCFLKNVNGMWLLRQCLEQWKKQGYDISIEELIAACATQPAPDHLIDVDDPEFLLPGNLPAVINARRAQSGHGALTNGREGIVRMANIVLHSLAARYVQVLADVAAITRKKIRRLYIVGGGGRNELLNRLTAERTGLEVVVGSAESSTVGNFAVQLAALAGDYDAATGVKFDAVAKYADALVGDSLESSLASKSSRL
ncbi:MAG TPA: FGGY-family carbohydrate kinase [Candidatus Acidoferrales bacterium]|nr:FGGY-family carbohydrate kinase [Candidatus Acidoferrales bacterium]